MEILNKYSYDPQTDFLGKGGFATVYKAYDLKLDMPVALKFFQPQDQANKYTIINEIKRAIILSHPNIVKYYGVETLINRNFHGQEEEVQIGVMEFVQEGQMKTYMTQNPLNLDQLKKLLIDILEGLKYLHSEGVIHRDIKPQNILLGRDKQNRLVAKIADFGISKSADSNQASASILLGTIEYMAPEQFNPERYGVNKKISYNVDIWAFGVTAFYLLTGNLLFGSRSGDTSAAEMISKIVNAEGLGNKLTSIEQPFKSVLEKCIVSNANDRTNDIDELIAILKGVVYKKEEDRVDVFAASPTLNHFNSPSTSQAAQSISADDQTQEISLPTSPLKKKKETSKTAHKPVVAKPIADDDSTQEIQLPNKTQQGVKEDTGPIVVKKKKTGLIIGVVVVLLAFAGGYFAYTKYSSSTVLLANENNEAIENTILRIAYNMKGIYSYEKEFLMGSNDSKRQLDGPQHLVKIKGFNLNGFEVTQSEWNIIMKDNRFIDTSKGNYPADSISWNDAKAFVDTLNNYVIKYRKKITELSNSEFIKKTTPFFIDELNRLIKVYERNNHLTEAEDMRKRQIDFLTKINNNDSTLLHSFKYLKNFVSNAQLKFRLPTDAEWEFAAQELKNIKKIDPLDNCSWNSNNSGKKSHEVGGKLPNPHRLYDMLGNVYEWTEDWYGLYNQPSPKEGKVIRGGDYENDIFFVHLTARNAEVVNKRNKNIGFRLAADFFEREAKTQSKKQEDEIELDSIISAVDTIRH